MALFSEITEYWPHQEDLIRLILDNPGVEVLIRVPCDINFKGFGSMDVRMGAPFFEEYFLTDDCEVIAKTDYHKYDGDIDDYEWQKAIIVPVVKWPEE